MLWAAFTVALYGFLRVSELCNTQSSLVKRHYFLEANVPYIS